MQEGLASVLLAASDATARRRLRERLEREGLTVTEAGDGREALRHLDRAPPDLLVLDLLLPELDGLEILRELRARRERPPVVAYLGVSGRESLLQTARLLGATAALGGPLNIEAVAAAALDALPHSCSG